MAAERFRSDLEVIVSEPGILARKADELLDYLRNSAKKQCRETARTLSHRDLVGALMAFSLPTLDVLRTTRGLEVYRERHVDELCIQIYKKVHLDQRFLALQEMKGDASESEYGMAFSLHLGQKASTLFSSLGYDMETTLPWRLLGWRSRSGTNCRR